MSKSLLPVFSSRSFVISSLTFKSLINFESIYMLGKIDRSHFFFFFYCDFPIFSTLCTVETVLSPLYILGFFLINELTIYVWIYLQLIILFSSLCISFSVEILYEKDNPGSLKFILDF